MKTALKKLASTLSVLGFGVAIALPALAQSNFTPGPANNPSQPGAPPTNRDFGVPPTGGTSQPGGENVPGTVSPANRPVQPFTPLANSSGQTIDALVRTSPDLELFNALLRVADSEGILSTQFSGDDDYTVFAPTDFALAQLPPGTFKALVQPENRDLLARVLENHIVRGRVSSNDLVARQVRSEGGNPLVAQGGAGVIAIGNARVIAPDVAAQNGVIHVVDNIILPADVQSRLIGITSPQPVAPGQPLR